MKKVYFWCREIGGDTIFYSFDTELNLDDYSDQDDILLNEKIIDNLQYYSNSGILDNWGVIKIEKSDSKIKTEYKIDNSLTKKEKSTYLTVKELSIISKDKKIEKLKKANITNKNEYHNLDLKELRILYDDTIKKVSDIKTKIVEAKNDEYRKKKAEKRDELLKVNGFVSESGWIDRNGKYWNVQSVDHDEVATLKWGSVWQAEQSNIRISSTIMGLYIIYSFDAKRPPNNKQFATLYRWSEHFNNDREVKKFEKQIHEWFDEKY